MKEGFSSCSRVHNAEQVESDGFEVIWIEENDQISIIDEISVFDEEEAVDC